MDQHDHSHPSHTAKCDACNYIAQVHAHTAEDAVDALSVDLAKHNKVVHNEDTVPESIKDAVRTKMQTAS